MVVAVTALVIAASGTAVAATALVNGDKLIKKGTLSGNRLRGHTLTGRQINLKKLGTVPNAANAANAGHANTAANATDLGGQPASAYASSGSLSYTSATLLNGWTYGGFSSNQPGYTKDAFGIVHLHGSLKGGTSSTSAFVLPAGFRPLASSWFPVYTYAGSEGSLYVGNDGTVEPFGTNVGSFTSLEGVTFSGS